MLDSGHFSDKNSTGADDPALGERRENRRIPLLFAKSIGRIRENDIEARAGIARDPAVCVGDNDIRTRRRGIFQNRLKVGFERPYMPEARLYEGRAFRAARRSGSCARRTCPLR
jgi:hypothetical protein